MNKHEDFLLRLCSEIYNAELEAQGFLGPELFVMRKDKVRIDIYKESTNHHVPHIHITHSDKIDVSMSLINFDILAGSIDGKTKKALLKVLQPKQAQLQEIWKELNDKDNSVGAQKLISNLGF